ncbi:exodeoxyribonuclease V subunit gamma [Rubricoccus marinus]|uniref:RecC C-terminal domain-containing protein n=1 Tax=Rubricoccus marinus TaxID=716817 RepID=A0A259TVT5_9BACT|nr:exodeoxyribonuclease V subunit gamma [Rubricoccus marinus]OZC01816.1 hypothetical protein BSZ36_01720 [Rubricoccus marinus]
MPNPGLHVLTAPRLEPLLTRLAETMRQRPLAPFQRETILVAQNQALRTWVENELARELGCAASIEMRSPREVVTSLMRQLVPESMPPEGERGHPFEVDGLTWRILGVLEDLPASGGTYDRVRAYLERAADEGEEGSGTMALASRLAQLYDDYQLYRTDCLAAWASGATVAHGWEDEPWQAHLWCHLLQSAPSNREGRVMDRATSTLRLLDVLGQSDEVRETLARVSLFGTTVVPPLFWRALHALGRHVPVTAYAAVAAPLAPEAERRTPEAMQRHPLLRDLGGRTRDWVAVMRDVAGHKWEPEPCESDAPPSAPEASGDPLCALHALQAALVADTPPAAPVTCPEDDRSIRIHECHSPLRELEVLRDEILDAFDTLGDLRPGEIGVLVPDMTTYAPLIDAVFGSEKVAGVRVPYHIADPPFSPEARVLDAFARVLALDSGRATASDLIGLLDVPVIRRAARIHESELGTLLDWVREARVHWGRDAAHKAGYGLPEDDVHTWRFGLDRLLVGYAIGREDEVVMGRLPVAEAGLDGADLLGRFAEWATALFDALAHLRQRRPLASWREDLLLFVDGVFMPREEAELGALVALRTAIDRLVALDEPETVVTASTVRGHLQSALSGIDRREPHLTGKVTFGSPLALRHVPFRVLAVVGLGDGFPGTDARPAFDLLGHERRAGDPDLHADDRLSFLAAVLAARQRLVLSRVARSHMDNAERAASVALDAFRDACRKTFGAEASGAFVIAHPLQPSSPGYVSRQRPELFTFAEQHVLPQPEPGAPEGLRFFEAPAPDLEFVLPEETHETTAAALARAWSNPCRAHTDALGLDLRLEDAALADDEPVELDGLAFHGVKRDVLDGDLLGRDAPTIADRLQRSGQLPPGDLADVYVGRAMRAVGDVADHVRSHGETEKRALHVACPEGRWRVDASVDYAPEAGALRWRPGKLRGTDLLFAWADHLALCADETVDGVRRTVVHGTDASAAFGPLAEDEARALLQFLIRGAIAFQHVPPPLFARASYDHARQRRGSWEHDFRRKILAQEAWKPMRMGRSVALDTPEQFAVLKPDVRKAFDGQYETFCDITDPAVALCYRRRAPLDTMTASFDRWSRLLWGPVFSAMEDE